MVMAYNMKVKNTPFHQNQLPMPVSPPVPFEVDRQTVDRVNKERGFQPMLSEGDG